MTSESGTHGRYFPLTGVGLIAIALVAAGCAENRRFAKEGATRATKALVVPNRITPPVTVARIEGAPAVWRLNARVAKALRDRDVPAGTEGRGKASYTLNGRAERLAPADGSATPRLRIAWTLLDAEGKRVGSALQIAVHPVAAGARLDGNIDKKVDPVALDRLARIAAERLTPLVPHTALGGGEAGRAGDPMWRRLTGAPAGPPVTALGREDARNGGRGLSARFLRLRNVTTVAAHSPEERIALKRQETAAAPAVAKRAAAPVIKPAEPEGAALTKHSVVTERIAFEAKPGTGPTVVRAATPRVIPVVASGARSRRAEVLRKDATIRPAPGTRKFADAGSGTAKPVQTAEAAGGDGEAAGFWVQLASNPNAKASHAAWEALVAAHGDLLGRQPHAVNRADLGRKGVYYRLQLGPYPNIAQARRVCASLRAVRVACLLMAARGEVAAHGPAARRVVTKPLTPKAETPEAKRPKTPATAKRARPAGTGAAATAAAKPKTGALKSAAGAASAVRPAAGAPKAKPDPKPGATAKAHAGKPETRADKLPFQRSRALPGLTD